MPLYRESDCMTDILRMGLPMAGMTLEGCLREGVEKVASEPES